VSFSVKKTHQKYFIVGLIYSQHVVCQMISVRDIMWYDNVSNWPAQINVTLWILDSLEYDTIGYCIITRPM